MAIITMQDIYKSRFELRKIEKHKHERFVSRFEPLARRSCLHSVKDFHYLYKGSPHKIQSSILYTRRGHIANSTLHKRNAHSKYTYTNG